MSDSQVLTEKYAVGQLNAFIKDADLTKAVEQQEIQDLWGDLSENSQVTNSIPTH